MPQRTHWQVELLPLHDLVRRFHNGSVRIPPYARPFQWSGDDVARIFDSILRGFPIGMIVVTESHAEAAMVSLGGVQTAAPADNHAWVVIDGTQRLTAVVATLDGNSSDARFKLSYDLAGNRVLSEGGNSSRKDALPLAVAWDTHRLHGWLDKRPWLTREQKNRAFRVSDTLRECRIPLMVIVGDGEFETEIFARVNTSGRTLTRQEIEQVRRVEERSAEGSAGPPGLSSLVESSRAAGFGTPTEGLLLCCVDAVGGSVESLTEVFPQVLSYLHDSVGIPHVRLLPHDDVLPVVARFVARFGDPEGRSAELLRRWVWRSGTVDPPPDLERVLSEIGQRPLAEANRLLRMLTPPTGAWKPDPFGTRLDRTSGRLNVLGLLSVRPSLLVAVRPGLLFEDPNSLGVLLEPGQPLAAESGLVGSLLDSGEELLTPFLGAEAADRPWAHSLANFLVHPSAPTGVLLEAVLTGSAADDEELLSGHCLDHVCVQALREGAYEVFAARRAELTRRVIVRHVQGYARWGFRDGAELPSLSSRSGQDERETNRGRAPEEST